MPSFSTSLLRLSLLLALTLAGASCQNAKTAFQFRPAQAHLAASAPGIAAATSEASPAAAPNSSVVTSVSPAVMHIARQLTAHPRLVRHLLKLAAAPGKSARLAPGSKAQRFASPIRFQQKQVAAENGLGTLFLGVLGILALLIGLIGLIFGGGGFFGLLAAAGAVALLISILVPLLTSS